METIKQKIIEHAYRIRSENPFFIKAAKGSLSPKNVTNYLSSLRYMLSLTPPFLNLSIQLAHQRQDSQLTEYFRQKLREETGHDEWASNDLQKLQGHFSMKEAEFKPVSSMIKLGQYIKNLIELEPKLYVTYITWAEFITVLVGGELVANLVTKCGVPKEALSAITNHVELDVEHADHGFQELNDLLKSEELIHQSEKALMEFTTIFDQACAEMVESQEEVLLV